MASAGNSRSGRSAKFFKRQEEHQGAEILTSLRQRPAQGDSQRPIPLRPSQKASSDVVQTLPHPHKNPSWLKLLLVLQRTSSALTFLLVVGLLVVYGWTVYTQQRWGRAYGRMEALQKQERQMMAANEVIKNQMAKQAEIPDSGLVLPEPSNTIFLTPAPQRPPVTPEVNMPPPQPIPARPLGY